MDVKGRAAGTETPAAQSIAGARDFQMDIRNGSGFQKATGVAFLDEHRGKY